MSIPAGALLASLLIASGLALAGQPLNTDWFLQVNAAGPETLQHLAAHLTLLGSGYAVVLLMLAFDRGHGLGAALVLRTLLIGAVMARAGKALLAQPRPLRVLDEGLVHVIGAPVASSNAMPSGHTLTAFAGALALWWIWQRGAQGTPRGPIRHARLTLMLMLMLAASVAWSRVAVGAHWPADVLAGAGCGLLTAMLAMRWERHGRWARVLSKPLPQVGVALLEITVALVWLKLDLHQPGTQALQAALGAVGLASAGWRLTHTLRPALASVRARLPGPARSEHGATDAP